MYTRFVERMRWQIEIISTNEAEVGGYKEVIAKINGQGLTQNLNLNPAVIGFKEFLILKHKEEFILQHVQLQFCQKR